MPRGQKTTAVTVRLTDDELSQLEAVRQKLGLSNRTATLHRMVVDGCRQVVEERRPEPSPAPTVGPTPKKPAAPKPSPQPVRRAEKKDEVEYPCPKCGGQTLKHPTYRACWRRGGDPDCRWRSDKP